MRFKLNFTKPGAAHRLLKCVRRTFLLFVSLWHKQGQQGGWCWEILCALAGWAENDRHSSCLCVSVLYCFVFFIFSVRIKTDVRMKTNRWRQMNPAQFSWSAGHCNTTPGAGRGRVLLQVQACRWSYGRYFPEACWNRAFLLHWYSRLPLISASISSDSCWRLLFLLIFTFLGRQSVSSSVNKLVAMSTTHLTTWIKPNVKLRSYMSRVGSVKKTEA